MRPPRIAPPASIIAHHVPRSVQHVPFSRTVRPHSVIAKTVVRPQSRAQRQQCRLQALQRRQDRAELDAIGAPAWQRETGDTCLALQSLSDIGGQPICVACGCLRGSCCVSSSGTVVSVALVISSAGRSVRNARFRSRRSNARARLTSQGIMAGSCTPASRCRLSSKTAPSSAWAFCPPSPAPQRMAASVCVEIIASDLNLMAGCLHLGLGDANHNSVVVVRFCNALLARIWLPSSSVYSASASRRDCASGRLLDSRAVTSP